MRSVKRRSVTLLVALLVFVGLTAKGQTEVDRKGVTDAMNAYFDAFYKGDAEVFEKHFSTEVKKFGFWKSQKSGKFDKEPLTYQGMKDYIHRIKKDGTGSNDVSIRSFEIYEVEDKIASAKLTAWWGIDYVLLVKNEDIWQFEMILWQGPFSTIAK